MPLPLQLFDLSQDPEGTVDLANSPARVLGRLRGLLDEWWTGAGEDGLTPLRGGPPGKC